jgi:hypothetical protein
MLCLKCNLIENNLGAKVTVHEFQDILLLHKTHEKNKFYRSHSI